MTLLEDLKAQLAAGTATVTDPVSLVGSDYSIAMVYFKPAPAPVVVEPPPPVEPPPAEPPPPVEPTGPRNLIEAHASGSSSVVIDVPFAAGKPYTLNLVAGGPATSSITVYTRSVKGKSALAKQIGPGKLFQVFAPAPGIVGLVFETKGTSPAWTSASLVEGGTLPTPAEPPVVVTPPPVEPPPVVTPPPVVEPPPVVVPPPVVTPPPATKGKALVGLNLSNAEMGGAVPGTLNKDYAYPTDKYLDWVVSTGVKLVRLAFKWRRLITSTTATSFKSSDIPHIIRIVNYLNARGITVVLNMHDYGRYQGNTVGHPVVPIEFFASSWGMFAEQFKDADVWFGLMNEPHDQDYKLMHKGSKAAIAAIRAKGAKQRILVPAYAWAGAHSFLSSSAALFLSEPVEDDTWSIEVHQYLDSDNSGTHDAVVPGKGAGVLKPFTEWCRANGKTAFLGEHGVARDEASLKEMRDMLTYLHANPDVWVGQTYWAAGAWWGVTYSRAIGDNKTNEQLAVLKEFM